MHHFLVGHDMDVHLGHEFHLVERAAVAIGPATSATETADFMDRHAAGADLIEATLDLIELVSLDDGFDPLHAGIFGQITLPECFVQVKTE